jgi:hypothetical protein
MQKSEKTKRSGGPRPIGGGSPVPPGAPNVCHRASFVRQTDAVNRPSRKKF